MYKFRISLIILTAIACQNKNNTSERQKGIPIAKENTIIANVDTIKEDKTNETIKNKSIEKDNYIEDQWVLEELFAIVSERDLAQRFGQEHVIRKNKLINSGLRVPVSIIYEGTEQQLIFKWKTIDTTTKELKGLEYIETTGNQWHTYEGIRVGIDLKKLERLNDSSFFFYGFGWDFGGIAIFEHGELAPTASIMGIRLGVDNIISSDFKKLISNKKYSSANKYAQKVNPKIISLKMMVH